MDYQVVNFARYGGPEVLTLQTVSGLPEPGAGEVRVKVLARSAAFTDTLIRRGIYPDVKQKPPIIPGYDMLGVVDALGPGVTGLAAGDKVAELTIIGSYAEYMILRADRLTRVPEGVDDAQALALVLSYMTAYQMLTRCARVRAGDSILIHGAGGAVGGALLQLGSVLGLTLYGTASSSQHDALRRFGCVPIDYKAEDFVQRMNSLEPGGVTAVFDAVGGRHFRRSLKTLRAGGTLVAYGSINATSSLDLIGDFLRVLLWNSLPWMPAATFYSIGAWHRQHHDWFKADLAMLLGWLAEGKIAPVIERKMRLEEASAAHALIEAGQARGKIVLICDA